MNTCDKCKRPRASLFYLTIYDKFCRRCAPKARNDLKERRELVRKLPDVPAILAPLGYRLVHDSVFKDQITASTFASVLYDYPNFGRAQ